MEPLEPLELQVCNAEGGDDAERVDLRSLWDGRRIILCFVRHLGCAFCHQQVAALQAISAKLAEDDVHVVVVSLGTKTQAKFFRVRGQVFFIKGEHARARARACTS